jgi:hypothetical protein
MPRRHRRAPQPAGPTGGRSLSERTEPYGGVDYRVRTLRGDSPSSSGGPYRCPGCDQLLEGRAPHIVAWPAHDRDAADRRHWHTVCWANRETRQPTSRR